MSGSIKLGNTDANNSYNIAYYSQDRTVVGNKTIDKRLTFNDKIFEPYSSTELLEGDKLSVAKFNMIQMSIDTTTNAIDDNLWLRTRYFGSNQSGETAPSQVFKMLVPNNQNFFQQLPIQNKFVDFAFINDTNEYTSCNVDINFTTNPTWQPAISVGMPMSNTGDLQVAHPQAVVNDQRADLIGERYKNSFRRVVNGVIDYSNATPWVYPLQFGGVEKPSGAPSDILSFSNVAARVSFENTHASDNVPIYIQGLDQNGDRAVERLASNVATSGLSYSVIDFATICNDAGLGITGLNGPINIKADSGGNPRFNTINVGANTTQTLQFYTSRHSHTILNRISLNGYVASGEYLFEVYCVKITDSGIPSVNSKRLIHSCGLWDNNDININMDINIKIGNEWGQAFLVWGQITTGTAHRVGDGMCLTGSFDITEVFSSNNNLGLTANTQFT